ncbi:DUF4097 family beta strand repeat-containing protein [Paenibacillus hamazuiensis]|uniref:DUF4097 family beta strand repeat-containing protein n=1 Tax=Paenibacillus hamazuiensis TaxID=2936508 RepID=UPI00200F993B|nr:DUF4097 family beta strand repeat-containing protein [Paenibacillus hamazuiensis]
MHKVGRFTAAVMLICVGLAVIADKSTGSHFTQLALQWWPVLLILLGVELVLYNFRHANADKPLRLDVGGILLALILSAVVMGGSQATQFYEKWMSFDGVLSYADESGYKFEKAAVSIPLDADTEKLFVENPSGSVSVKAGPVEQVQVEAVVWVDKVGQDEAATIAEQSGVEWDTSRSVLSIKAQGKEYGEKGLFSRRKPRVNLTVILPAKQKVDVELKLTNGKAEAAQLPIREELSVRTTNGEIAVTDLSGNVSLSTTNGQIVASKIGGYADLETTNGSVALKEIQGNVEAKTTNGEVQADHVNGSLTVKTTNGTVTVTEATGQLEIQTNNGSIRAQSRKVGGDWELKASHGAIDLALPANADMEVDGEGRLTDVRSDFPLNISKDSVSGRIGKGTYELKLDTAGPVVIRKLD